MVKNFKNMRRIILVLIIPFLASVEICAFQSQGSVISGRITNNEGEPLPGAGISIEGTITGVLSDEEGYYFISGLRDGIYIINISFLGYENIRKEIILKGKAILNVKLFPQPYLAGEVIINAIRAGEKSPLAYSTISGGTIRKQNLGMDLPYILSLTPSLVETSEAGTGIGYTNLRIRGSDASRINVTIDGIPLNDPESQQVFWVDLPDLASSVDNLQVQRGVGTSSNGAGAFGATISIQTKNFENEPYAQFSTSGGSFGTICNMIAAGTGLLADRFAFQVRLSDINSDGYIDRTGSDHRSAYISGLLRSGRSRLKANVIIGEEKTGIGWWGVPAEMLKANRRYNPAGEYTDDQGNIQYYENETDNYRQNHYQLLYNLRINDQLNLSSALHYTYGTGYYEEFREDESYSDYGLDDVTLGSVTVTATDMIRRKWMSNDFYGFVWSLKYGNGSINASFGGGANSYSGDHYGKIMWMRTSGLEESNYQWYLNNGTKHEVSLYGKTEYEVTDDFTIYGDLQYRYINYRMEGLDDDLKDLVQNHDFGFFNPKAGLFWSLSPDQDAYISFSIANREPARSDFKEASGDPDATPKPERLYDTELGYKVHGRNSNAGINLYGMIYHNQLVPTGELSDVGYPIMTNVKNSYRIGIELSTSLKPTSFIDWNLNLTLSSNKILDFVEYYQDYDTLTWDWEYKNKNHGKTDISYSPSVIGSNDITFKIFRNMELHLISKYVGKQFFDNTMSKKRMIDPYFINSLRFDFNPVIPKIKSAEFQVLINNILNHEYESNAYGGNWYEEGNEKTWSYYFPQAGINFMIKAGLTF
jgi:iron complex outermembrane recepter protein